MEEGQCKIRKRGCSSSSSSSLVRKYRFKRAILVGKRVGSGTPVPTPKMIVSISPVTGDGGEFLKFPTSSSVRNGRDGVVSARRLAATLWEINEVASPRGIKEIGDAPPAVDCSDPAQSTLPKKVNRSGFTGHRRRKSAPDYPKLLATLPGGEVDDFFSNDNLLEVENRSSRPQFKDLSKGLVTAKELLKVLTHIWRLEEKHSSSAKSLVLALRVELDRASVQVDQLAQDQWSYKREMKYVMQHLAEERSVYRAKVRDKVSRVAEELEAERKMRKQAERLNKRLGKELAEVKRRLEKAVRELESERRAKEVLEQVCDELAKGIGEDREEVEELKRASEKAWEEVEKEREMLQLADVLREERVQMKLAEAKYHFEEKNADIEKLKNKLEAYMCNGGTMNEDGDDNESPASANSEVLRDFLRKTLGKVCQNPNIEAEDSEVDDGEESENQEDSGKSDLHSIELEAEDNRKTFKWGYSPPTSGHDDSKRSSVEVFKGRKSLSEKIQWATISLLKGNSTAKDDAAALQKDETVEGLEKRRSSVSSSHSRSSRHKDQEDEVKKHKSLKSLKKHIMSSFKLGSSQGFSSPAKQWGQTVERS